MIVRKTVYNKIKLWLNLIEISVSTDGIFKEFADKIKLFLIKTLMYYL